MELLFMLLSLPLMLGAGFALDGASRSAANDDTVPDEDGAGDEAEDAPAVQRAAMPEGANGEDGHAAALWPEDADAPDDPETAAGDTRATGPAVLTDYAPGADRILIEADTFTPNGGNTLMLQQVEEGVAGRLVNGTTGLDAPALFLRGARLEEVNLADFVVAENGTAGGQVQLAPA